MARRTDPSPAEVLRALEDLTLASAWRQYRETAIPAGAGSAQIAACYDAFLAGAWTFVAYVLAALQVDEATRIRLLERLNQEIQGELRRLELSRLGGSANG